MVTHIVLWNFQENLTQEQREAAGQKIKAELERLVSIVPGVHSIEVKMNRMASSTRDLALFVECESEEALKQYAVHPEHLKVVDYIKTVTCERTAFDY